MVKKIVLEEKESRRATLFYNDIYEIVQKKIIGNQSNNMYYEINEIRKEEKKKYNINI